MPCSFLLDGRPRPAVPGVPTQWDVSEYQGDKYMSPPSDKCWKWSYDRGVGTIPTVCPDGTEKSGLLCYPPCPADTPIGVGVSTVFAKTRRLGATISSARDHGKPLPYRLGGTDAFANMSDVAWQSLKNGKCDCPCSLQPVCWSSCPDGYTDTGAFCTKWPDTYAKDSYTNGVGTSPPIDGNGCASIGKANYQGLCYAYVQARSVKLSQSGLRRVCMP